MLRSIGYREAYRPKKICNQGDAERSTCTLIQICAIGMTALNSQFSPATYSFLNESIGLAEAARIDS